MHFAVKAHFAVQVYYVVTKELWISCVAEEVGDPPYFYIGVSKVGVYFRPIGKETQKQLTPITYACWLSVLCDYLAIYFV